MPPSLCFYNSSSTQHPSPVLVKRNSSYVQLFTRHCYEKKDLKWFHAHWLLLNSSLHTGKDTSTVQRVPYMHSKKQ